MAIAALEQLIASQGALIDALDQGDVAALEEATRGVARAIDAVRHERANAQSERLRVDYALRQTEAARGRVNFLTDRVAQRLDRLTGRRGRGFVQTYTNTGKLGQKLLA